MSDSGRRPGTSTAVAQRIAQLERESGDTFRCDAWMHGLVGVPVRRTPSASEQAIDERADSMTIFDDLRSSHEVQRSLARTLTHGRASADSRRVAFLALANELDAHATAEERHLYVPLLMIDAGLSVSRHALADHHKAEKVVEQLRGVDPTTDHFGELARQLSAEVRDHLDEEEHGTFQLAGKLLSKTRLRELAAGYRAEYARRGGPHGV